MVHGTGPIHEKHPELPEQASNAALYITHPERATNVRDLHHSEEDQKLSSAGASTSLKYARQQDLPSYPTVGTDIRSSAGTAANLANAQKSSPSLWKPGLSSSASQAALLAANVKTKQIWQPSEVSAAGSRAAIHAHKEGGKVNLWHPESTKEGNSAAGTALRSKGLSPEMDYGYTADGHKRALVAASGAISSRPRAGSNPVSAPSEVSSSPPRGALNAATVAHQPSIASSYNRQNRMSFSADAAALEAARVQHYSQNVSREMFTEHPPVALEVEEKRRKDAIHASAVSMAKQMDEVIQKRKQPVNIPGSAGRIAVKRAQSVHVPQAPADDLRQKAIQYIHLQEAAHKSASERLKKLYTDDEAAFRDYYGYSPAPGRSRLSVRGRQRPRALSESSHTRKKRGGRGADDSSDEDEEAIRASMAPPSIREQMAPQFDEKKRHQDRVNLLAAAQRNVQSNISSIDRQIHETTGRVQPSVQKDWEAKARAKASAESKTRLETHGKVYIGGGKYIDQAEVDAVASARVKPTLDNINEKAEKRRAEDTEKRLDKEEQKRQAQVQREWRAEEKLAMKKEKEELKHRKDEDRHRHKDGKLRHIFSGRKSEESHRHAQDDKSAATAKSDVPAIAGKEKATSSPTSPVSATTGESAARPTTTSDTAPAVNDTSAPAGATSQSQISPTSPTRVEEPAKAAESSDPKPVKFESVRNEPRGIKNTLLSKFKRSKPRREDEASKPAAAPAVAQPASTTAARSETEETSTTAVAPAMIAPLAVPAVTTTSALLFSSSSSKTSPETEEPVSALPTTADEPHTNRGSTSAVRTSLSISSISSTASSKQNDTAIAESSKSESKAESDALREREREGKSRFGRRAGTRDSESDFYDAKDEPSLVSRESEGGGGGGGGVRGLAMKAGGTTAKDGDDGLAPPRASFASRTKSESPARDSRFQEQL